MRQPISSRRLLATGVLAALAGILFVATEPAYATTIVPPCARAASLQAADLNCALQTFQNVARLIFGVTGSFALLMFVYGGFTLLTSGGVEAKVTTGKTIVKNAVIGIFLIMLAFYIIDYAILTLRGYERHTEGEACYGGAGKYVRVGSGSGGIILECQFLCARVEGYSCQTTAPEGWTCTTDYYCPGGATGGSGGTSGTRPQCCAPPEPAEGSAPVLPATNAPATNAS